MRLWSRPAGARPRGRRIALSIATAVTVSAGLLALTGPARMPGSFVVRHIDAAFVRMTRPAPVPARSATPSATSSATPSGQALAFGGVATVGALFPADATGLRTGCGHFCTASVVHSPSGDLAVTAAHCVTGGTSPVVFVPGYHDGIAPYGTWQVTR